MGNVGAFILFPIGLWSPIFPTKSVKREEEVLIIAKETLLTTMAVQNKVQIDNFFFMNVKDKSLSKIC